MNIGEAFSRVFDGLTVDLTVDGEAVNDWPVKYHYGDQKELVKWILDKGNESKYPLIWYVIAPYQELHGVYYTESSLIILQNTLVDWFNDERFVKSYTEIIEPVWQVVKDRIETNRYIHVEGQTLRDKYDLKDEPNYGVPTDDVRLRQNDFTTKSTKGDESILPDYVDAKIIKFNFRITPDCIK